jgi:hypothetical protein
MRLAALCRGIGVAVALAACANIVGIEDAELDPESGASGGSNSSSGGASGATPGAGDAGADGDPNSPHSILCARYCTAVMKNCTGPVQVYESPTVCRRVCARLDAGENNARSGNSINCRLFHANQIELIGEEETECPAAGPGGDGVCGENCDGYCTLLAALCPVTLSLECRVSCPSIPDQGGYDSSHTSGGDLQCRLYHVSAATIDATFHCPHAAGAGPCAG